MPELEKVAPECIDTDAVFMFRNRRRGCSSLVLTPASQLQVAKWLGAHSQLVVLRAPQLLQAAAAAATDTYVYLLTGQRFGQHAAW